jgi:hypothetical protein
MKQKKIKMPKDINKDKTIVKKKRRTIYFKNQLMLEKINKILTKYLKTP